MSAYSSRWHRRPYKPLELPDIAAERLVDVCTRWARGSLAHTRHVHYNDRQNIGWDQSRLSRNTDLLLYLHGFLSLQLYHHFSSSAVRPTPEALEHPAILEQLWALGVGPP